MTHRSQALQIRDRTNRVLLRATRQSRLQRLSQVWVGIGLAIIYKYQIDRRINASMHQQNTIDTMGQRDLRRSAAAAAPYCRIKKESHSLSKKRKDHHHQVSGGITASISDDVLADIFTRLPDMATVVRCAATCRCWAHLVATRAAVICPRLPPLGRFFPNLAVGLFHQEKDWPTTRTRDASSPRPCFIATASGTRFIRGDGQSPLAILGQDGGDRLLDHSRPVASRNGRLVLELRRDRRQDRASDGLRLAICNPMMLDNIHVIPPLALVGKNTTKILDYGCALLTGHDLSPSCHQDFFHILLIYNHNRPGGQSTVLRCYSSDTGRWGPKTESTVKIDQKVSGP